MADDENQEVENQEQSGPPPLPEMWELASKAPSKVTIFLKKKVAEAAETEDLSPVVEIISTRHRDTNETILQWATSTGALKLVEFLVSKFGRDALCFDNKDALAIADKWTEERQRLAEKERERLDNPDQEEEEQSEEVDFAKTLAEGEFEGKASKYFIDQVGALGVYQGDKSPEGEKHGQGAYLFPNGDFHLGAYNNGVREGKGLYYYKDSGHLYIGDFSQDKRNGQGRMIYKDGGKYTGSWADDLRSGKGRHFYPTGDVYEGQWLDDRYDGPGNFEFADTSSYRGVFSNGDVIRGQWKQLNGTIFYGTFKNFKPCGKGIFVFKGYLQAGSFSAKGEWTPGTTLDIPIHEAKPDVLKSGGVVPTGDLSTQPDRLVDVITNQTYLNWAERCQTILSELPAEVPAVAN